MPDGVNAWVYEKIAIFETAQFRFVNFYYDA